MMSYFADPRNLVKLKFGFGRNPQNSLRTNFTIFPFKLQRIRSFKYRLINCIGYCNEQNYKQFIASRHSSKTAGQICSFWLIWNQFLGHLSQNNYTFEMNGKISCHAAILCSFVIFWWWKLGKYWVKIGECCGKRENGFWVSPSTIS